MSGDSRRSRWTWAAATVGLAMAVASVASGTLLGAHTSDFRAATAVVAAGAFAGGPSPSPGPNV